MQMNEGADATFYPSWYKPDSRVSPGLSTLDKQHIMWSAQPSWDSLSEAQDTVQAMTDFQIQPQPPRSQDSQLLCEPQTQQRAEDADISEVENDEEEDMQGWVCLLGTLDKSLNLVEGSFDFGEGGLDIFSDSNGYTLSMQPETSSGNCKLSDERAEDADEKVQLEEDILGLNGAPQLEDRLSGEGHLEAEMMVKESVWSDEGRESFGNSLSDLEKDSVAIMRNSSEVKNDTLNVEDEGMDSKNTLVQGDRESDVEAGSLEIAEKKQEDREDNEQPQEFDGKMETSVAESEEKKNSCVSLQVSVMWFNLLHHHRIIISQALALFTHLLMWLHLHIVLFFFSLLFGCHCF